MLGTGILHKDDDDTVDASESMNGYSKAPEGTAMKRGVI